MHHADDRMLIYQHKAGTHIPCPPNQWDLLWLTEKCRLDWLVPRLRDERATEERTHERCHPAGDLRILPRERPCRVDFRAPRGERRQACKPPAQWRAHHHR